MRTILIEQDKRRIQKNNGTLEAGNRLLLLEFERVSLRKN